MTYTRRIRLSLDIEETFEVAEEDSDPSPSLPPQPVGQTVTEVIDAFRPVAKCRNATPFPFRRVG
jgi:hypothetical protein